MKTLNIKNGFLSIAESKASCSKCKKDIAFDVLEKKWLKNKERHIMHHTCECKHKMGIAIDMKGDFVSFEFKNLKNG